MPEKFQKCKYSYCITDNLVPCQLTVDHTYCYFCGAPATEQNYICPNYAIKTVLRKNVGSKQRDALMDAVIRCDGCRDAALFGDIYYSLDVDFAAMPDALEDVVDKEEKIKVPKTVSKILSHELPDPIKCCGVDWGIGSVSAPVLRSVGIENGKLMFYVEVERFEGVREEDPPHQNFNIVVDYKHTGDVVWHTADSPNTNFGGTVMLPNGEVLHIIFIMQSFTTTLKRKQLRYCKVLFAILLTP